MPRFKPRPLGREAQTLPSAQCSPQDKKVSWKISKSSFFPELLHARQFPLFNIKKKDFGLIKKSLSKRIAALGVFSLHVQKLQIKFKFLCIQIIFLNEWRWFRWWRIGFNRRPSGPKFAISKANACFSSLFYHISTGTYRSTWRVSSSVQMLSK